MTRKTSNGPDRNDVRDLLNRFDATRRDPPGGNGGGSPDGSGGDDDDGLTERQQEKIEHILDDTRERNPDALARAKTRLQHEREAGIPPSDGTGTLSAGADALMDALCGGPALMPSRGATAGDGDGGDR